MKFNWRICAALVLSATTILAAQVRAELHLLGSPQVRRELKISHAASLRILHNLNLVTRANSGGTMTMEQYRQHRAFQKRVDAKALNREVLALLSPSQKRRLEQIGLQQIGAYIWVSSWARSTAARRMGFSKVQQEEIQRVDNREFKRYVRGVQTLSRDGDKWRGRLDKKRYAAKYAAYDRQFERLGERRSSVLRRTTERVLTARQKAIWKAMLGKPFNLKTLTYDTEIYASN